MGRDEKMVFVATCILGGLGEATERWDRHREWSGATSDDLSHNPRQEQSARGQVADRRGMVVTSVGRHARARPVGQKQGRLRQGLRERGGKRGVLRGRRASRALLHGGSVGGAMGIMTQADGHLLCNAMCKRE